jgi:hypothetical protein
MKLGFKPVFNLGVPRRGSVGAGDLSREREEVLLG